MINVIARAHRVTAAALERSAIYAAQKLSKTFSDEKLLDARRRALAAASELWSRPTTMLWD
jgi:hypothetical protein